MALEVAPTLGLIRIDRKLIIVGTGHSLQCGSDPYTESEIEGFRNFVRNLCQREKIRFIAEEMSNDGLKDHSAESSIFWPLQSEAALKVEHAYIDINRSLRDKLGIGDLGLRKAAIRPDDMEPDKKLEQLYDMNLTHAIRECSWLAKILSKNSWPTLLICGADHVKSMVSRAKSVEIQVVVANEDYQP